MPPRLPLGPAPCGLLGGHQLAGRRRRRPPTWSSSGYDRRRRRRRRVGGDTGGDNRGRRAARRRGRSVSGRRARRGDRGRVELQVGRQRDGSSPSTSPRRRAAARRRRRRPRQPPPAVLRRDARPAAAEVRRADRRPARARGTPRAHPPPTPATPHLPRRGRSSRTRRPATGATRRGCTAARSVHTCPLGQRTGPPVADDAATNPPGTPSTAPSTAPRVPPRTFGRRRSSARSTRPSRRSTTRLRRCRSAPPPPGSSTVDHALALGLLATAGPSGVASRSTGSPRSSDATAIAAPSAPSTTCGAASSPSRSSQTAGRATAGPVDGTGDDERSVSPPVGGGAGRVVAGFRVDGRPGTSVGRREHREAGRLAGVRPPVPTPSHGRPPAGATTARRRERRTGPFHRQRADVGRRRVDHRRDGVDGALGVGGAVDVGGIAPSQLHAAQRWPPARRPESAFGGRLGVLAQEDRDRTAQWYS